MSGPTRAQRWLRVSLAHMLTLADIVSLRTMAGGFLPDATYPPDLVMHALLTAACAAWRRDNGALTAIAYGFHAC